MNLSVWFLPVTIEIMNEDSKSEFQLIISGEVELGSFCDSLSSATVSYAIVAREENGWKQISGQSTGVSLKCHSSSVEFVWNVPIGVSYSSVTPAGWPRIVISVFTADWRGRDILYGYGVGLVPSQPGRHTREISLFTPESTSWWGSLSGWFVGKRPILIDPLEFLTRGNEGQNESVLMRPLPDASVVVNFNITIKNAEQLNLRFC